MAFSGVWMVDGYKVSGTLGRLQLRAASRNSKGIIEIGDLRVRANASPNGHVLISDGACVTPGAERLWQGSYFGYNLGDIDIAVDPTTTAARSDLIYARVEDPTISSSPWDHAPSGTGEGDVWYPIYLKGVTSGTTDVPDNITGVPLARIDIPTGTTNITQAMIKDLRVMANAREEQQMLTLQGVWSSPDNVGNTSTWEQFPNGADWPIDVPEWAAQAVLSVTMGGLQYMTGVGSASGVNEARGGFRAGLGSVYTPESGYWHRAIPQYTRVEGIIGGTVEISQAMRGTSQNFTVYGHGETGYKDGLQADGWASLIATISFRELPRYDVPDRSPA